eukprot:GFUD01028472.1.p1 GENE.GFUD01028472.1~~GFUD01028472.1.p1  ORF type:complete len:141 (-),score=54.69 GFUD01028472.1:213-635(-)
MVLAYNDIMELLRVLSEDRNLRVTVSESGKGALVTGGVAGLGGMVLGPMGLAIGGAVGGCLAAWMGQGKFKPLALVITEDMKEEQRQRMVTGVRAIVDNIDAGDAMTLIAMVQGNQMLKNRVVTEMVTFLSQQCNIYVNE